MPKILNPGVSFMLRNVKGICAVANSQTSKTGTKTTAHSYYVYS